MNVTHRSRTGLFAVQPRFLVQLLSFTFAIIAVLSCTSFAASATKCGHPKLSGSFLQPDLGDKWSILQWQKEFRYMQEASLNQLFLQWTADSKQKTTIFPSSLSGYTQSTKHDVVERALRTADENGAQVFVGLQVNDDWWTIYLSDASWLNNEARVANALADDLWSRYQHHPSFAGWYLPFEVDNVETTRAEWNNLVAFYRTVGGHLHQITPEKPIVISPFYTTQDAMSSAQWQKMWEYVLKRSLIDVIALQDGVGAGHATRADLPEWFTAVHNAIVNARPSTLLWADTETFTPESLTMPIRNIVNDMVAVQPYVSNYLSFSFNHYLSPQQVDPLYYKTYMAYLASGKVESVAPTAVDNLSAAAVDSSTVRLTWSGATDNFGVVGYRLLREGYREITIQGRATSYIDSGLDAGMTYTYQVRAFDAAGNASPWSAVASASTPPPTLYPVNIGVGKPYAASMQADPSYPDSGGVELTDGTIGTTDFSDPAWQGRATTQTYGFTLDLGSLQVIREIRSHWLQDEESGILFPQKATYWVSPDNVTFSSVGTVKNPLHIPGTRVWWYTLTDLASVTGRYVQMRVIPGGYAEWTFLDEIEVRQ